MKPGESGELHLTNNNEIVGVFEAVRLTHSRMWAPESYSLLESFIFTQSPELESDPSAPDSITLPADECATIIAVVRRFVEQKYRFYDYRRSYQKVARVALREYDFETRIV